MSKASKKIKNIINDLQKEYCARYGAVIFNAEAIDTENGVEIKGKVLVKNQKNQILGEIKKRGVRIIKEEIKIISDPEENLEIGWGEVSETPIDVLGKYIAKEFLTPHAINKFRATQLIKGDVVRILAEKDGQRLIQTPDLSIGWVKKSKITAQKSKDQIKKYRNNWKKIIRAEENKLLHIKINRDIKINNLINDFLGIPYVLGGTTKIGIDCSALTQKFYRELYGLILPRHSKDQAKCGVSVKGLKRVKIYDLLFLKLKSNGHYHIGVVVDIGPEKEKIEPKNIRIFNARLSNGGVIIQALDEILKDYELLDIRRIIE